MEGYKKLRLKDVHLRIPYSEYEFWAEESAKRGISTALYVTNFLRDEKLRIEKEQLEEGKIAPQNVNNNFSLKFTELTDDAIERKLQGFEMKYQLGSETLYRLYQQGKAPEWIEDRVLWAGLYRLKKDEDDME